MNESRMRKCTQTFCGASPSSPFSLQPLPKALAKGLELPDPTFPDGFDRSNQQLRGSTWSQAARQINWMEVSWVWQ